MRLFLAAIATASVLQPAGSTDAQTRPAAVAPHFAGKDGAAATDISGIACAAPDPQGRRTCLAVNDEGSTAQWATLDGDRLVPGVLVTLAQSAAPTPATHQTTCPGGTAKPEKQDVDGEAVAYAAPNWYVIGSHGCSRKKGLYSPAAFLLYRVPPGAARADVATGKIADALRTSPETARYAERGLEVEPAPTPAGLIPPRQGHANGLTIEGLAITSGTLRVGLRAPVVSERAILADFDLAALFRPGAAAARPKVTSLRLGPANGVRDMAALPDGRLLVLAGPAQSQTGTSSLFIVETSGSARQVGGWSRPAGPNLPKAEAVAILVSGQSSPSALIMYDGPTDGAPELVTLDLLTVAGSRK